MTEIKVLGSSNPTKIGHLILRSITADGVVDLVCSDQKSMTIATLSVIAANSHVKPLMPDVEIVMTSSLRMVGDVVEFRLTCHPAHSSIIESGFLEMSSSLEVPIIVAEEKVRFKKVHHKLRGVTKPHGGEDELASPDNDVPIEELIARFEWSDYDD